jgi:hypothetical protein
LPCTRPTWRPSTSPARAATVADCSPPAPGNITTGCRWCAPSRFLAVPPWSATGDRRASTSGRTPSSTWTAPATSSTTNQVRLRVEGRWGLAVRRPSAFAAVDLSAA